MGEITLFNMIGLYFSSFTLSMKGYFTDHSVLLSVHFIHELVNGGQIHLLFCGSKEQLADMFTKPLGTSAFVYQREHLGIDSVDDVLPFEIKRVC